MRKTFPSKDPHQPDYYIFVVNSVEWEPYTTGGEIVAALAGRGAWLASRFTPYCGDYKPGDRALFYVAGRRARHFVGDAVIDQSVRSMSGEERDLAKRLGLEGFDRGIPLRDTRIWPSPVAIKPYLDQLEFIKDKRNWGLNLRMAAARIPRQDYEYLIGESERTSAKSTS